MYKSIKVVPNCFSGLKFIKTQHFKMCANFQIQPVGRFVGTSAAIKRPKVCCQFSMCFRCLQLSRKGEERLQMVLTLSSLYSSRQYESAGELFGPLASVVGGS